MDIQGPVLRFGAQIPDPVQKNISGHNIPFIFHQKKQKLIYLKICGRCPDCEKKYRENRGATSGEDR